MYKIYRPSSVGNFVECTVMDDYTVTVSFEVIDLLADKAFAVLQICSMQAYEDNKSGTEVDALGQNLAAIQFLKTNMVGTGPFTLNATDYVMGVEIIYRAWEDYRIEGQPYLDSIKYLDTTSRDTGILIGMMSSKELMLIGGLNMADPSFGASATGIGFIDPSLGFSSGEGNVAVLIPNSTNLSTEGSSAHPELYGNGNPLMKKEVRQALAYAMDYEGIRLALGGNTDFCSQLAVPGTDIYNDALKPYWGDNHTANTEKALALLKAEGYSQSNPLYVTIWSTSASDFAKAEAIQGEWNKLGIVQCVIESTTFGDFLPKQKIGSWYGFRISGWNILKDEVNEFKSRMDSFGAGINAADQINSLLKQSAAARTIDDRYTYQQELVTLVAEGCYVMPFQGISLNSNYSAPYVKDLGYDGYNYRYWTPEKVYLDLPQ